MADGFQGLCSNHIGPAPYVRGGILYKIVNISKVLQAVRMNLKLHGGFFGFSVKLLSFLRRQGIGAALTRLSFLDSSLQSGRAYQLWISKYETFFSRKHLPSDARVSGIEPHSLVSLILANTTGTADQLIGSIESVSSQSYPYWELWIELDTLPEKAREYSLGLAAIDSRFKIGATQRDSHSDIANSALDKAMGRYVVFLDGTGRLHRDALRWVIQEITLNPDACFVYCDEDQIDNDHQRFAPHFKPDWNPDLFLASDYTGIFTVFDMDLARKLGGFRAGYRSSQQYDFSLRAIEHLNSVNIRHIPRVLYHSYGYAEISDRCEAVGSDKFRSAADAVIDHLDRTGINAIVSEAPDLPSYRRIRYALPSPLPKITLIIPTRNKLELLQRCIHSIRVKTDYSNYDIIVVDNGSDDMPTLSYLESLRGEGEVHVIRDDGTFNFSRLNNLAVKQASGELIGLLNNDLEVMNADWLSEMASHAMRPEIGIVGARLWYPDDTIQHAGVILADGVPGHVYKGLARDCKGYFGRAVLTQNFVAVTAACMVLRKSIYIEAGGLDETFAVAFNDIDLCLRVRSLGYRNLWTPYAELYHHESASRGLENTAEKISRYLQELALLRERWGAEMFVDPYYNPNLDPRSKDFSLAWPPVRFDRSAG